MPHLTRAVIQRRRRLEHTGAGYVNPDDERPEVGQKIIRSLHVLHLCDMHKSVYQNSQSLTYKSQIQN